MLLFSNKLNTILFDSFGKMMKNIDNNRKKMKKNV